MANSVHLPALPIWIVSRRFAWPVIAISLCMFLWDQTRLHPYQYVYFNEFSRFLGVDDLFETDYWGTSAREHARLLQTDIHLGQTPPACMVIRSFFIDPLSIRLFALNRWKQSVHRFKDPGPLLQLPVPQIEFPCRKSVI